MTQAVLHTNHGDIALDLFDDFAPKTVANFVELANGTREYLDMTTGKRATGPFYDGTIFHRVIDGFMIQGGDPDGRGTGGQRIYTLSEKTGEVVGLLTVFDDDEVVCITGQGKTIRINVNSVGTMGRSAQGVRILDIESPDMLIGLDVVARDEE